MELKELLAGLRGDSADEENKKPKRNDWDEIDPASGEAYENIPGVENPPELEAAETAGFAAASGGTGSPVLNAAKAVGKAAIKKSLMERLKENMPLGGERKSGSGSPLSSASSEVRQTALSSGENLQALKQAGVGRAEEEVAKMAKERQGELQALRDIKAGNKQAGSLRADSAPSEYNFKELNKIEQPPERTLSWDSLKEKKKAPSEWVYSTESGSPGMRKRRPGEKD